MTQHTKGKLKIANNGSIGSIESEIGTTIGQTFQTKQIKCAADHDERKANARRLVACWNACEDIDTDTLEELGPDTTLVKIAITALAKLDAALIQRKELLEALKQLVIVSQNADACQGTVEVARAAIHKAEGVKE